MKPKRKRTPDAPPRPYAAALVLLALLAGYAVWVLGVLEGRG